MVMLYKIKYSNISKTFINKSHLALYLASVLKISVNNRNSIKELEKICRANDIILEVIK